MYHLSVPVNILRFRAQKESYLQELKRINPRRVMLCGSVNDIFDSSCDAYTHLPELKEEVALLKVNGYEVVFWVGGFGHGEPLAGEDARAVRYTLITGSDGVTTNAYCPLDENFRRDYANGLKELAKAEPDAIMLDDDFRISARAYNFGCCCPLHMEQYRKVLGENVKPEDMEKLVLTGGANPYRKAYLQVLGDSVRDFAKYIRAELDTVAPHIPMSACACFGTWGNDGFNSIEIAKILAGNNAPFLRTFGAPYHYKRQNVLRGIERTRMQAAWCRGEGLEVFAEGDVYPRPRYNTPARTAELYDTALLASGEVDGILKYVFDYNRDIDYERGYVNLHVKNAPVRQGVADLFRGKKTVGVRVFEKMDKLPLWQLPESPEKDALTYLKKEELGGTAAEILSHNGIPTVWEAGGEYPVAVFGENARYVEDADLKNGAFIDASAAKILQERGIDCGLVRTTLGQFSAEQFPGHDLPQIGLDAVRLHKMEIAPNARVLSTLQPGDAPGAYLYENANGQRFYCIAYDQYNTVTVPNYAYGYYRQEQIAESLAWLCRKPLPATCLKNPHVYLMTSRGEDAMSVLVINHFMDELIAPVICLDRPYKEIRFVNCTGNLEGDKVTLLEVMPYGVAAFEVK